MLFCLDDALSQIRDNSATGAARMALPASARSVRPGGTYWSEQQRANSTSAADSYWRLRSRRVCRPERLQVAGLHVDAQGFDRLGFTPLANRAMSGDLANVWPMSTTCSTRKPMRSQRSMLPAARNTALIEASLHTHVEVMRALLERKASPDCANFNGQTALQVAALRNSALAARAA